MSVNWKIHSWFPSLEDMLGTVHLFELLKGTTCGVTNLHVFYQIQIYALESFS